MALFAQAREPAVFSRGVWNWAQFSMHLRQKGYKQDWTRDLICAWVIKQSGSGRCFLSDSERNE